MRFTLVLWFCFNIKLLAELQAELEREVEARRQAEVFLEKERTTRAAAEIQLTEEAKARSEVEKICSKERIHRERAETAFKEGKKAQAALELQLTHLRHSEATLRTQVSDAQAWCTTAFVHYEKLKAEAEAAVHRVRENCVSAEKLTNEAQADTRRLEGFLEKEKAERQRLVQMLEIETLGRARIEHLLEVRRTEEGALIDARSAKADLEEKVIRLKEQLDGEYQKSARLVRLLEQVKIECSAPFVVPAILDVFAMIVGITDEALGEMAYSSPRLDQF